MPEAHLRLIGGLMGQLNPLLEASFEIDAQSYGEFNGYDGMELKGEIERLMPSEWLWRELAPEEFLRRFAEQELLYHKPSFESPTDERTHLVALDCGPGMLGRPRLIALAALLSLNALAKAQGARLVWIAPQGGVTDWKMILTQKDLKAFLIAANPLSLKSAGLDDLLQNLPGKKVLEADIVLWTIGATALAAGDATFKTNQIVISERLAANDDGLPIAEAQIRLTSYFGRQRETTVTFPAEEECVSLLREPFRPPRSNIVSKRHIESEANPAWAPQGVLVVPDKNKIVARIKDGLLVLSLNPANGQIFDKHLIKIENFDNILGLRLMSDHVTVALTRKYNSFSQLTLKRFQVYKTLEAIPEIRLDQDDPLAVNKHPKNALPPLVKPGRKFRLLALTAKGEHYVIHKHKAERHAQLPHLPVIGVRDDWAFMLSGPASARLIMARNLATSQCMTFALPENAAVTGLSDMMTWPERMNAYQPSLLLARCDDGHWRGQRGRPNLAQYDQFSPEFIDADLSEIRDAIPLGQYKAQRGEPPYPAYRMCLISPADGARYYCDFNLAGGVEIEPLDEGGADWLEEIDPSKEEVELAPNIAMYKFWPFSWTTDEKGFVETIHRQAPVEETPYGKEAQTCLVAELVENAKCLSE